MIKSLTFLDCIDNDIQAVRMGLEPTIRSWISVYRTDAVTKLCHRTTIYSAQKLVNLSVPTFLYCCCVMIMVLKLQDQLSKKRGDKEYRKYILNIPPEIIEELGWKGGTDLDARITGKNKLSLVAKGARK